VARQPEEVGIDSAGRCHATTVVAAQPSGFDGSMAANRVRSTALGYALLAPSLFGVVTFLLLPMLVVFWLSLHRWDLLGPIRFVGLDNWQSVLTDRSFATSLVVTLAFIAMVVPVQTVLGLIAAAMLARGLPGTGFFRTLYVLPWICAPLAIAVLWRWILAPTDGAVSTVLGHSIEWLSDPGLALPVVSAVVVWTNVGSFEAALDAMVACVHRRDRLDAAIIVMADESEFTPVVRGLGCLRGISTLTAFGLAVEIGDWHRLTGRSIGAYLGLVPCEYSSGESRVQGGLTKTGNGHARRLLVEAAWHHRPHYRPSRDLRRRWEAAPAAAQERAHAANHRLHTRWAGFDQRKKRPVIANAAIARELAGWCWSLAVMHD